MSDKSGAPTPAVIGYNFVQQYYGEVLFKRPEHLHRFYNDQSTFCHASGSEKREPVSGLSAIKAQIAQLGLGDSIVNLACDSLDAQPSEGGGVLLVVTGSITISGMDRRNFVQTFFLCRQYQNKNRYTYFVRNDNFRILDVLPKWPQGMQPEFHFARDKAAESDPACSAVFVEQAGHVTDNTVVEVIGEMAAVATTVGDDALPSAAVAVSRAGLDKCG